MNTNEYPRISQWCLCVFLFFFPWQTVWIVRERFADGVKLQYDTLGFYATEALLWSAVICFLFSFVRMWRKRPRAPFAWTPDRVFTLACLAVVIYASASSFWAPDPTLARQHALWILEAFLLFFLLFLGALRKEKAWLWFSLGSVAPAVLGVAQFLTQTTFTSTLLGLAAHPAWEAGVSIVDAGNFGRWVRAYGTFPHPNLFGGYLVVAIIALDALARNKKYMIDDKKNIIYHLSYIIISLLQWSALFFTFSRSAWLAAIVWLIISIKHEAYSMKHFAYRASLIVILVVLFFPLAHTRIAGSTIPETRSVAERTSGYREAIVLWKTHPLTGVGIGNYTIAAARLFPNRAPWEYQPVHLVPLLILAELGVIGIIFLLGICITYHVKPNIYYLLPLLPLLLFDHYLWSSYAGLLLLALFFLSTIAPQDIPKIALDTPSPR